MSKPQLFIDNRLYVFDSEAGAVVEQEREDGAGSGAARPSSSARPWSRPGSSITRLIGLIWIDYRNGLVVLIGLV